MMHDDDKSKLYEVAVVTPLDESKNLSQRLGHKVLLKREDMQPVHSFKIRGAYNKIASLSDDELSKGVIAASAGNHAQGVALSAQKLGIDALIVMPRTAPQIKVDAVRAYGAQVELAGDNYSQAAERCKELIAETDMTYIAPFDDELVIEGQGTIADEIIDQCPKVTHIFVPVGGGGLIAGIAQNIARRNLGIEVVGVEPCDSNALQVSLNTGQRVELENVGIFSDGVAVKQIGKLNFDIAKKLIKQVITVSADQTCAAIKDIFEQSRTIVEPAGALAVAGIKCAGLPSDAVAVAVCSGSNMSFERLQFVAERTLIGSGHEALYSVELSEKPDALKKFCNEVVSGRNITEFNYRLQSRKAAHIFLGVSVENDQDKLDFQHLMDEKGYQFDDLTTDPVAKEHIRHMIGGGSELAENEVIYSVGFPERPGAMLGFVDDLNSVQGGVNISLFHYRGQGGDTGRVLIGLELPSGQGVDSQAHQKRLDRLESSGYSLLLVDDSPSVRQFLSC